MIGKFEKQIKICMGGKYPPYFSNLANLYKTNKELDFVDYSEFY